MKTPATSKIPASGQCIILNKAPEEMQKKDKNPTTFLNKFIKLIFIIPRTNIHKI